MDNFTTPETANFLYLGLGSVALFTLGYIGTLFVRYRNLQKDIELIQQLAEDE
jgi:hypothetical protein